MGSAKRPSGRIADGSIRGHVGFPESVHLISEALGLGVNRVEEFQEPIISTIHPQTQHVMVHPGMVAGCRHTCIGYRGDVEVIRLIHPQQVLPQLEGQGTGANTTLWVPQRSTW